MTVTTARIEELRAQIAEMRERPPGRGLVIDFTCDEVEKFLEAIEAKGYAQLFALNQSQADIIDEKASHLEALGRDHEFLLAAMHNAGLQHDRIYEGEGDEKHTVRFVVVAGITGEPLALGDLHASIAKQAERIDHLQNQIDQDAATVSTLNDTVRAITTERDALQVTADDLRGVISTRDAEIAQLKLHTE